ncbi:MAG: thioredoxin domain-containing protein [Patescibacteria group bacterium]|nr:thioredoxin domain-containing protein [Patescibacteria group bacterium]
MEEKSNKFLIPTAIVIAAGLIVWGIISTNKEPKFIEDQLVVTEREQSTTQTTTIKPYSIRKTDYILGNPDANLVFVNFSDFECSFCKIFHQTMHRIIDEYGKEGKVAWIFRQFPLHGVTSEKKSAAVKCAGQLGGNTKFWEMSDKIFQTEFSNEEKFVVEQLGELARGMNIDEKKFLACLDSKAILEILQQEYQTGIDAGVLGTSNAQGGTPFTLIATKLGKTYPINGAQPYNVIQPIIDLILQGN